LPFLVHAQKFIIRAQSTLPLEKTVVSNAGSGMHNNWLASHSFSGTPMSLQAYFAFVAACIALALLPGPIVTLVIANGLRHGTRAALINILGAQAGLAIVIGVVAIGLTSLMATMGYWFDWVRFAGAAYLVWLGIKLIRFPVEGLNTEEPPLPPRGGFFLQGFLVLLSNPKVLVFFGAFIPQFMDMNRDHVSQVALLGVTFMVVAAITDGMYALLSGRARLIFSSRRTRLLSRVSGGFMIGGGIWLALTRAR
jgi:threonine/homoserine/homoserine lactone efflux protein